MARARPMTEELWLKSRDLKRLFAQSREDFDGTAFRADVEQKIARARKVGYAGDAVGAVLVCAAA